MLFDDDSLCENRIQSKRTKEQSCGCVSCFRCDCNHTDDGGKNQQTDAAQDLRSTLSTISFSIHDLHLPMLGFFSVGKASHNQCMSTGNCTSVAIKMHSFCTTTVATMCKRLVRLMDIVGVILIVNADLFKFAHSYYLLAWANIV